MDKEVYFSEEEKSKAESLQTDIASKRLELQNEIASKQNELRNYIQTVKRKYGLDKPKLCIISYRQAERDGLRLAFISWTDYHTDKFQAVFNEVSYQNRKGTVIDTNRFLSFSYEILEDVTVEEAKEILKERKKHLKIE